MTGGEVDVGDGGAGDVELPTPPAPAVPPLRFSLTIVDGRARLAGSPGPVPVLGRVDRLALEVPGLRFPFDLSQGARAFRSRRCRLVEFGFSVAPLELEHALARAALGRFGLGEATVALTPAGLRLGLRAKVAGREAEVSAKVAFTALAQGQWRVNLHDARVHGFVPIPAPLLLAALPAALGLFAGPDATDPTGAPAQIHWTAAAPPLLRPRGLTEFDLDVAAMVLVALLPAAGWRLPALGDGAGDEALASLPVNLGAGRIGFALGRAGEIVEAAPLPPIDADATTRAIPMPIPDAPADRGLAALAEAALFTGDVRPAIEGFRRALVAQPDNDFARERLFQLLSASPDGLVELEALADDCLLARPNFLLALVAKAVAAAEDGRAPEAGWLYARVASEAEAAGELLDETAARLAAVEQFTLAGDHDAAAVALDKARARRPEHPGVRRAVAARVKGAP
jgi:hypothetical protein